MAENKKRKRPKKRNKSYPPLSKTDKILYRAFEFTAALILFISVAGYIFFADDFIFRNPDVLAYGERWTMLLMMPFFITFAVVVFDADRKKVPIFGNQKVDYYNTLNHRFTLPLFDKRYENLKNYHKARKTFFKKAVIWSVVFSVLFCVGLLGYTGRHEFDDNGITTYSIFNNPIKEYSYDEVERYELSAAKHFRVSKYGGSTTCEVYLTLYLESGKTYSVNYDFCRDAYAMKTLENQLLGKPKTIDASYLEEFIERRDLTADETRILYELFEQ